MIEISNLKKMIFWFYREMSLIEFPFAIIQLSLWILISKFIKTKFSTNKTVVAFTSIHYNGNSRAVFDYMKNLDDYDCYWIARNRKSLNDLRKNHEKCIYAFFPIISMKYLLNTDILVTSDTALNSLFFYKKPKVIQLWHAVSTKGIPPHKNDLDAWCVSSDYIKQRYVELYKLPPSKIHVTGYPSLDILYNHLRNKSLRKEFDNKYKINGKILFYTPTWDCGLWGWGNQYAQFEKLCMFCRNNNLTLLLRLHPLAKINKGKLKRIVQKYNVLWLDMDKESDTTKLLAVSDILITDWSSTCVDFLLTKRPIIYLEVKKDFFTKSRGEAEVPPELRAGEIALDTDGFYKAITKVLRDGNRFIADQEKSLRIIHGNIDGKASERVFKVINEILKNNTIKKEKG